MVGIRNGSPSTSDAHKMSAVFSGSGNYLDKAGFNYTEDSPTHSIKKRKEAGKIEKTCSFCGKGIEKVNRLVKAPQSDIFICDTCTRIMFNLIDCENKMKTAEKKRALSKAALNTGTVKNGPVDTPAEICKYLNRHIVGQEKAKKILSVAVYNHAKRLKDKRIKKSNILLVGPSGCGKTLLAKTLSKLLDVPFAIADATAMTEAGYVGEDADACLQRLLDAAGGDVKLAQKGIVFIDEIDKISCKESGNRGVGDGAVQAALLKMVEGSEVSIPTDGDRRNPNTEYITMDTANILFIFGGAFDGLTDNWRDGKRNIGFSVGDTQTEPVKKASISTEDLVKYGMMPELIGRIPVICQLDSLKEEDLVRILTEPEDAITKEYEALLKKDGVRLVFEPDALEEIARTAIERKTGARGLRGILEDLMLDTMYELPGLSDISKCVITADSVRTNQPVLVKKRIRKKTKDMAGASI